METKFQPYVGPRPYERDDLALFFGRDYEADELLSLIISYRELLFYAQSGTGKTSLLNAKVIPFLEKEGFEILPLARVQGMISPDIRPDEIKNIYVFNTLMCWAKDEIPPRQLVQMSLSDFLKTSKRPTDEDGLSLPRVIIFDQFEELFALYPDRWRDRKDFFEQVRDTLKDDYRLLRVVFTIREDYIAQLDPFASLLSEKLRIRFRLERLRKEAALAAITVPLRGTKHSFAEGIAEKLVEDLLKTRVESITGETVEVAGEFVEPVQLQVVCQNLWQELPPDTSQITEKHLLKLGNVDRPLAKFYESTIHAAKQETGIRENELRDWCEKWLITSTGTRGIVHRGTKMTEGIPNEALKILEDRHLIRSEWRAGAHWYELTHDRFVSPIQASNKKWKAQCEEKVQQANLLLRQSEQYIASNKYERAQDYSQKAYRISDEIGDESGKAFAHLYLGDACKGQKLYQEAFEAYSNALQMGKKSGDNELIAYLLQTIGSLLADQMDRYNEALQYFTDYIDLLPYEPLGYSSRAAAYWYNGQYSEAVEDYTRLIELDSASTFSFGAYNSRGQIYAEMGEYRKAIVDLDRAIEIGGKSDPIGVAYAHNGLGLAYGGLGQYQRAFSDFKTSIKGSPDNAWVYYNRAMIYENMKQTEKAIADYKTALKKNDPPLNLRKRERAEARILELSS